MGSILALQAGITFINEALFRGSLCPAVDQYVVGLLRLMLRRLKY